MKNDLITVSIVSHSHEKYLESLLKDLVIFQELEKIIITLNIYTRKINIPQNLKNKIKIIKNKKKKGYGENHNNAFKFCSTPFFLVMNPDVSIKKNFLFKDLILNLHVW